MNHDAPPDVSVVVAVWNEASESLLLLLDRVAQTLDPIGISHEVVFVDNASVHTQWSLLDSIPRFRARARVVRLSRNFGQEYAVFLGSCVARGTFVVTLDSDLQTLPEAIPQFLEPLKLGAELVLGLRAPRVPQSWIRRVGSWGYNRLMSWRWGYANKDWGCGMTAIHRDVVDRIRCLPRRDKPLKVLALDCLAGPMQQVRVAEQPRHRGASSYPLFLCARVAWRHLRGAELGPPVWRDAPSTTNGNTTELALAPLTPIPQAVGREAG